MGPAERQALRNCRTEQSLQTETAVVEQMRCEPTNRCRSAGAHAGSRAYIRDPSDCRCAVATKTAPPAMAARSLTALSTSNSHRTSVGRGQFHPGVQRLRRTRSLHPGRTTASGHSLGCDLSRLDETRRADVTDGGIHGRRIQQCDQEFDCVSDVTRVRVARIAGDVLLMSDPGESDRNYANTQHEHGKS